jgi:hypothetical protein
MYYSTAVPTAVGSTLLSCSAGSYPAESRWLLAAASNRRGGGSLLVGSYVRFATWTVRWENAMRCCWHGMARHQAAAAVAAAAHLARRVAAAAAAVLHCTAPADSGLACEAAPLPLPVDCGCDGPSKKLRSAARGGTAPATSERGSPVVDACPGPASGWWHPRVSAADGDERRQCHLLCRGCRHLHQARDKASVCVSHEAHDAVIMPVLTIREPSFAHAG